jgi:hypothetical protein
MEMSTGATKTQLVEWVNGVFGTRYGCIKDIPAKAAARLLHGMLGPAMCPLNNVQFNDASSETVRHQNCVEVLLVLAPAAGYSGALTPAAWMAASSFSELLKFWRWLFKLQDGHSLPADFDVALQSANGRRTVRLGPGDHIHGTAAHGGSSSDAAEWAEPEDRISTSAEPLVAPFPDALHLGAPGKENARCYHCAPIVGKAMARDAKKLKAMQRAHAELLQALADRDVQRLAAILESV